MTAAQRAELLALLQQYADVFQWHEDDVGLTHLIEHTIDTGDTKPFRCRQFRTPHATMHDAKEQLKGLLRRKQVEPSTAPWTSPYLLIRQIKRDGTVKYRFVLGFRRLNDVTVKDAYPLPRIEVTLDALGGAKFFCVVDMARGYFQVPIAKKDRLRRQQ